MKFKEIIQPFLEYKKDYVRMSTLSNYAGHFDNHLVPYFGDYSEIKQENIDEFLFLKANQGASKKTLETYVVSLKTLFKWVNKNNIFPTLNFKANYPFVAKEKNEINPLTVDEAKAFAKYCEENFTFIRLVLYTALFTGLRAGEICGLQFKDIDTERGVLSVNKIVTRVNTSKILLKENQRPSEVIIGEPKTKGSIREIPLPKQVLQYYKSLSKIANPNFFIATNNTRPAEPNALRNELNRITENLEIQHIRLHDLRHTFATRCISVGIDPKTVSLLLGHSTVDITLKLYTHVDDYAKIEAINKLSKKMSWD